MFLRLGFVCFIHCGNKNSNVFRENGFIACVFRAFLVFFIPYHLLFQSRPTPIRFLVSTVVQVMWPL